MTQPDAMAYQGYRFIAMPEKMPIDRRIKDRDRTLWALLAQLAWYGCRDFPSLSTTGRVLGCSDDTVTRAIERLVSAGWLQYKRGRSGRRNTYVVVTDPKSARKLPVIPDAFLHAGHNIYALNQRSEPPAHTRIFAGGDTRNFAGLSFKQEGLKEVRAPHDERAVREEEPGSMRAVEPEANLPEPDEASRTPTKVRRRSRDASVRRATDSRPAYDNRVSRSDRATTSKDLAQYFADSATAKWTFDQMGPAPFNMQALAGGIAQWKREGRSAVEIRTMIDIFCSTAAPPVKESVRLWRGFLADRQRLFDQARRVVVDEQPAEERYAAPTPEGWTAHG